MTTNPSPRRSRLRSAALPLGCALTLALGLSACGDGSDDADAAELAAVTIAPTETPTASPTSSTDPSPGSSPDDAPSTTTSGATDDSRAGLADRLQGTDPDARVAVDADAEVDVLNQGGDGRTVRIEEARISRGTGFVVVTTLSRQVLGSAKVTQGSSPASVSLTSPITTTGEYLAVLYLDNGDGRFDAATDRMLIDEDAIEDLREDGVDVDSLATLSDADLAARLVDEAVDEDFSYRVG